MTLHEQEKQMNIFNLHRKDVTEPSALCRYLLLTLEQAQHAAFAYIRKHHTHCLDSDIINVSTHFPLLLVSSSQGLPRAPSPIPNSSLPKAYGQGPFLCLFSRTSSFLCLWGKTRYHSDPVHLTPHYLRPDAHY